MASTLSLINLRRSGSDGERYVVDRPAVNLDIGSSQAAASKQQVVTQLDRTDRHRQQPLFLSASSNRIFILTQIPDRSGLTGLTSLLRSSFDEPTSYAIEDDNVYRIVSNKAVYKYN